MSKKIILAGASGLIGGQVMALLSDRLASPSLHIVGRRKLDVVPDGVIQHVGDPKIWPTILETHGFDVAISCLGSTMKKAGSKEAFAAIDRDLVLQFAQITKVDGTPHFISVSSVGAGAASSNFYLATKGQADSGLKQLSFDRLDIMRPGLLTGERGGERRVGERLAVAFSPLTDVLTPKSFSRFRSIPAVSVARAIANLALDGGEGQFIHENDAITALAG